MSEFLNNIAFRGYILSHLRKQRVLHVGPLRSYACVWNEQDLVYVASEDHFVYGQQTVKTLMRYYMLSYVGLHCRYTHLHFSDMNGLYMIKSHVL